MVAPNVLRRSAPYETLITVHNVSEPVIAIVEVKVKAKILFPNEPLKVSGEITINNGETKMLILNVSMILP